MELFLEPISFLADPSKRVFWVYIIGALLVASFVTSMREGGFTPKGQLEALVNKRYWFNRSTATDYGLMWLNSVIRTTLIFPLFGARLAGALVVARYLQVNVGDFLVSDLHWLIIASVFSVTLFVFDDLSRFLLHRLMHRVPLLWKLHKVHHSATTLTPFTVFRVHPVESVLYTMRGFFVFSGVAGVFIWIFKGQLTALDILGVDALGFIFNLAAANLRHSHIPVTFGRAEAYFISPLQHQLHHSKDHNNVNFGSCLSIWDRWFETELRSKHVGRIDKLRFGLTNETIKRHDLPLTGCQRAFS